MYEANTSDYLKLSVNLLTNPCFMINLMNHEFLVVGFDVSVNLSSLNGLADGQWVPLEWIKECG